MVYLPDIVNQINAALKSRFGKYPTAAYHGLTTSAVTVDGDRTMSFPSIINLGGSVIYDVSFSKKIPMTIYHRALASSFTVGTQGSYGDGDLINDQCTTSMRLVCVGNRIDIAIEPEELAMILVDTLPTGVSAIGVKYMKVYPNSIQYDAQTVFAQEFKNIPFNIGPERFLFSINYTIGGGYFRGCLKNCDC